ncbi:MAG: HRDC domain-containing protein, partial [Candidatus Thermoplasmatota archaeon]|nr:HRDC domain-containing protein [Candidatus Thermoplasmatota archaeon]
YVVEKDFEDTVSRIILSAVRQFPEGVGKVKLSRLLRAKDPGFVISTRPDVRDMFGRLRLLDADQVLDFMESLVRLSLLDIQDPEFPRLVITRKGEHALSGSKQIPAMIPWPLPSKDIPVPVDEDAYDRLKVVRNRLARESSLPPYCVASNLTLVEMVNRGVSTTEDLLGVHGIGPGRVERYGKHLISALNRV